MNKILITGGAGFIGYHLAVKLAEDSSNEILIADNLKRGQKDKPFLQLLSKPHISFVEIDLTNYQEVKEKIWKHYDQVYHLAAMVGVKHCISQPAKVLDVNIRSTFNIIDLAKENRCGRLLFSSTGETYADGIELGVSAIPTTEDAPLIIKNIASPRSSYAGSKMVGEQLVIFNSNKFHSGSYDYVIVRYHNVYGPRMGYAHMLPEVITRTLSLENPFKVYGYNQTRSFCYVSDAVEQTILAMSSSNTKNEILHLGNNQEEILTVDGVKMVHSQLRIQPKLELVAAPEGSVTRRCPNISKVQALTGFIPKFNTRDGFKITTEWYVDHLKENKTWE